MLNTKSVYLLLEQIPGNNEKRKYYIRIAVDFLNNFLKLSNKNFNYKLNKKLTSFFSVFDLISRASIKKASSTLIDAFALVSINLIPYSMANCSPRSLET